MVVDSFGKCSVFEVNRDPSCYGQLSGDRGVAVLCVYIRTAVASLREDGGRVFTRAVRPVLLLFISFLFACCFGAVVVRVVLPRVCWGRLLAFVFEYSVMFGKIVRGSRRGCLYGVVCF